MIIFSNTHVSTKASRIISRLSSVAVTTVLSIIDVGSDDVEAAMLKSYFKYSEL